MSKRRRKSPFISGFCAYAPHQVACKGEFQNGAAIKPRMTLCSCSCHGDYEERLVAAGQAPREEVEETEDDDEDE